MMTLAESFFILHNIYRLLQALQYLVPISKTKSSIQTPHTFSLFSNRLAPSYSCGNIPHAISKPPLFQSQALSVRLLPPSNSSFLSLYLSDSSSALLPRACTCCSRPIANSPIRHAVLHVRCYSPPAWRQGDRV